MLNKSAMLCLTLSILILFSRNGCETNAQYIGRSRINTSYVANESDNDSTIALLRTYEIVDPVAIARNNSTKVYVTIRAFGMEFFLRLVEDRTLLADTKIIVTEYGRTFSLKDKPKFYRGNVLVDNIVTQSEVCGIVIDGRFQGIVTLEAETYYIEPVNTYLKHRSGSLIYRKSDVTVPFIDPEYSDIQTRVRRFRAMFHNTADNSRPENTRRKRNIDFNRPRSCGLLMFADHRFHNAIGHGNLIKTVAALTYRFRELDKVFREHDFNSDNIGDNFGFTLEVLYVHSDLSTSDIQYPFKMDTSNGEDMLRAFKRSVVANFGKHCINYAFTHKHWDKNVVGLAYTASPYYTTAGLCGASSNVGMVTSVIHGRTMTTVANLLVFVHEMGHSSGSDHDETYEKDDPESCKHPANIEGLYIMASHTTSPDKPNSFKFSTCSKLAIIAVLKSRIEMEESCFRDTAGGPYCGNQILDKGEECDCGTPAQCQKIDRCCTPMDTFYLGKELGDKQCTINRKKSYVCSPKSSACCNRQCRVFTGVKRCARETECQKPVNCNQKSADCPRADNKPDGTACSDGLFCRNGTCSMSICEQWGMTDCECESDESCIRCCSPTNSTSCEQVTVLSRRLGHTVATEASKYLVYGTLCHKKHGICDVTHECTVYTFDHGGFLGGLNAHIVRKWWLTNWYYPFIGVAGLLVLTYIFRRYLNCRKRIDYTSTAKRMGRILAWEYDMDKRLKVIKDRKKRIEKSCSKTTRQPFIDAMFRIKLLFPITPDSTLSRVLRSVTGEGVAVKQLLVLHAPMLRLFRSSRDKKRIRRHTMKLPILVET